MRRVLMVVGVALAAAGCGRDASVADVPDRPGVDPPSPELGPGPDPQLPQAPPGCADLFAQDRVPTYRIEISPVEWAKLEDELLHRPEREALGLDPNPYHPVVFRHEGEVVTTAMIRLKGKSSWDLAVELDPDPKMQFVVSFNELDRRGRFHGLRKLVLDMPRDDRTFLRQRLALAFLRDLALPAQCANSARVEINGAYYGLYTGMEAMDRELLQRAFPGAGEGDLWKYGRQLVTNEETATSTRRDALFAATTVAEVRALADLDHAVRAWAAEAMLPDADGYYGANNNFHLYDHPERGFLWLSSDLDATFSVRPHDYGPHLWARGMQPGKHYLMVLSTPEWMGRYLEALEEALAAYDPAKLEARLTGWAAQIARPAAEDPHRPFSMADHEGSVGRLGGFFARRAAFVRDWIGCRREGGADPDGDGAEWCYDCAEGDPAVHPGGVEACGNALDDDCDGLVDEGC